MTDHEKQLAMIARSIGLARSLELLLHDRGWDALLEDLRELAQERGNTDLADSLGNSPSVCHHFE